MRRMSRLPFALFWASATWIGLVFATAVGETPDDRGELAWTTFPEADDLERFHDTPYLWLGRVTIHLSIDVEPQAHHVLELLFGSKNDRREAVVSVNGHDLPVSGGGYDGFRWLQVPVPKEVQGEKYEVVLRRGHGKAAFLAGVRMTTNKEADPLVVPARENRPALRMRVKTSPPSRPDAFPEMRAVWDREPPPPRTPLDDAQVEAAFRQAERHGRRAAEAFYRCRKFVEGWLAHSDPETGLIPRNLSSGRDYWNAKDAAADNYPFMVLTAAMTDRDLYEGRMRQMLETEIRLTSRIDRLPDTYSFSKQGFLDEKPKLAGILFGGSEYVKDGLLPLTEWLGPSPWSERMVGIVDDIWKHAEVDTPFGKIPSTNVEVNGELLQACSRLYWFTGDEKYLGWAQRLGDDFLLGENHPTRDFKSLRLRDHGCEVVSGLSELYTAVSFADPEKKKAYEKPIHEMFDRILEVGRDERGMLYNSVNPTTGQHHAGICDTWGYNYNGVYTVYLIDKNPAYRQAVRHVLSNLKEHLTDYDWGSADEYADSIEGAINLLNREPDPSATEWIDSEIRDMWAKQRPDGVIEGWHGDGNSARTSIMYALWKTQGLSVQPWRADVRVGAVRHGDALCVSLMADKPWSGVLLFDKPRHKVNLHLPLDYPRINQFPEWFTAEADQEYGIEDLATGKTSSHLGKELWKGMAVELEPGVETRLKVCAREP